MNRVAPHQGFALMELLVFIIVTGLLMSTILLSAINGLRSAPTVHQAMVAMQTANRCLEWYVQQRRLKGYSTLSCPSTPAAGLCAAPSGYSVSSSVACTTWNSDTTYKTVTVTVSGKGNATASVQLGDY
jgi:type II secretory pathway pseudopilin PulG